MLVESAGSLDQVLLTGSGKISLGDSASDSITGESFDAPKVTLTNVNNDISGGGTIGGGNMALNNEAAGVIDATGTNAPIIDTGLNVVTNAGALNADAGW